MAGNASLPDGSELGTSYQVLAANMIDSTYNLRKVLTNEDSRAMESPKIFADVLAVNTMTAYASMHPEKGPLSATTSEERLGNGTTEYRVALHDRLGGGITYAVDSDLSVRVTPAQGFPDGRTVPLPTEEFRWNGHGRPKDGFLEHAVSGPDRKAVYVPYANPSLSGGDDLEGGAKLILDQGLSSFGAGKNARPPVLMAAEAAASHEGVRAVSGNGAFGKLKDGYSQEGRVVYNGFSVVEQSGSHGDIIFYNKHDLLRNAADRSEFDHAIESGKSIDISIRGNAATARIVEDVHRAVAPPSKADAQAAVDVLRESGVYMVSVSTLEPWNGKPQTGSFIDLGDGVVAQHAGRGIYRYMDVDEHLNGIAPPLGQTVSLNQAGEVQHAGQAQAQSLGRD